MAMKMSQRRLDTDENLTKLSYTRSDWQRPFALRNQQLTFEAWIIRDVLLVRTQDWLFVSAERPLRLAGFPDVYLRAHIWGAMWDRGCLADMVRCRLGHIPNHEPCMVCTGYSLATIAQWTISLMPDRLQVRASLPSSPRG
jgi:hypothetical protein